VAPSQPRPSRPPRADVVLAAVFCVLSLLQVAVAPIAGPAISVLVAVGSTLPLAWRRVHPAAAALTMTAVWLIPTPQGFLLLGYLIAALLYYSVGAHVYSVGAHVPQLRRVVVVTCIGVVVGVVGTLLGPEIWQAAIGAALAVAGPAAAGRLVAHQRSQTALLRELAGRLVQERATAERAAVAEERSRIARELHDVIGHEVTVIALQADAAAAALAKAPERAAAPIEAIRSSAVEALGEMRRVVGMLRAGRGGGPAPPARARRRRSSGGAVPGRRRAVDLTLRPPARPTHASVELAAYRLVQEGADQCPAASTRYAGRRAGRRRRHRGGGRGGQRQDGAISTPREASSGFGLVGMRERVRLLGGRLDAGPTDGGGFALTARLPLDLPGTP
jgi:signal transduction histidine kinase